MAATENSGATRRPRRGEHPLERPEPVGGDQPRREFLFDSIINRVPLIDVRMRLYRRFGLNLEDPDSTFIGRHTEIYGISGITIGAGASINRHCMIDGRGGLHIGRHVGIAERVMIVTGQHDFDLEDWQTKRYMPVTIGDRAFIHPRTFVCPGVTIGEGAVIGAQAVVTTDIEPWTIAVGNPARSIRARAEQDYTLNWRPNWR